MQSRRMVLLALFFAILAFILVMTRGGPPLAKNRFPWDGVSHTTEERSDEPTPSAILRKPVELAPLEVSGDIENPDGLEDEPLERGVVIVRLLDEEGCAYPYPWKLCIDPGWSSDASRTRNSMLLDVPARSPEVRLRGLPAGNWFPWIEFATGDQLRGPPIFLEPDEVERVDLHYAGADPKRCIVLNIYSRRGIDPELEHVRLLGEGSEPRFPAPPGWSGRAWIFADLPPGRYTLVVDDTRFEPWRMDGVAVGETVRARLRGASAIRLRVTREDGGATLPRYSVKLRSQDTGFFSAISLRGSHEKPGEEVLHKDIPSGSYALGIHAREFAPIRMILDRLEPGEVRQVNATFSNGGKIAGTVLWADGVTPVRGASVRLAAVDHEDPLAKFARGTLTNPRGAFSFERLPPGQYALHASFCRKWEVSFTGLTIDGEDVCRDLRLILPSRPSQGFLEGRLLAPEGTPLEGLIASARVSHDAPDHTDRSASVAADGSFTLGPLPCGPVRVRLEIPDGLSSEDIPRTRMQAHCCRDLGLVSIEAGKRIRQVFELGREAPGLVDVVVRVHGHVMSELKVVATPWHDPGACQFEVKADEEGRTRFTLFPGTWRIRVYEREWAWRSSDETPVCVGSASHQVLEVDVAFIEGALQLLDASTGQPLGMQSIFLSHPNSLWWTLVRTDAGGFLRLHHPAGELTLSLWRPVRDPFHELPHQTVHWTASGPEPEALRMAHRE